MESKLIIGICGTVGVGKTTISKLLEKELNYNLIEENFGDNPFLEKFYKDPKKYGFKSQLFFLSERIKQNNIIKKIKGSGIILDRTIYEDSEVFAKINYELGNLDKDEWNLYNSIYKNTISFGDYIKPDIIIYLDSEISEILNRLNNRNRSYEKVIDESYFKNLKKYYDDWINYVEEKHNIPVIKIINKNIDFSNKIEVNKFLNIIKENIDEKLKK